MGTSLSSRLRTSEDRPARALCFEYEGEERPVQYAWTLDFRRCYNCKTPMASVVSPHFQIGDDQLQLVLYPHGESEANKNYVSAFVRFVDLAEPLNKNLYRLSLVDGDNKITNNNLCTEKHRYVDEHTLQGCRKFIRHDRLFKSDTKVIRPNGDLVILCSQFDGELELRVAESCRERQISVERPKAADDLYRLLKHQNLSDVTLLSSDGKEVKAHKAVLAARSIYFSKLFELELPGVAQTFKEDFTSQVLDLVLLYLYVCDLGNVEPVAQELLVAADKYDLQELKEHCERLIGNSVNCGNAVELIVFADAHNCEILKIKIFDFLDNENEGRIYDGTALKNLASSHPHIVAELLRRKITRP